MKQKSIYVLELLASRLICKVFQCTPASWARSYCAVSRSIASMDRCELDDQWPDTFHLLTSARFEVIEDGRSIARQILIRKSLF
jgi:hypothetical protein